VLDESRDSREWDEDGGGVVSIGKSDVEVGMEGTRSVSTNRKQRG
jgi:hypothetical protein